MAAILPVSGNSRNARAECKSVRMAQSALELLTQVLQSNPQSLVVAFTDEAGNISVSWSDMPTRDLVYLKEFLNAGVYSKMMKSEASEPAPATPIRRRRASDAPRPS